MSERRGFWTRFSRAMGDPNHSSLPRRELTDTRVGTSVPLPVLSKEAQEFQEIRRGIERDRQSGAVEAARQSARQTEESARTLQEEFASFKELSDRLEERVKNLLNDLGIATFGSMSADERITSGQLSEPYDLELRQFQRVKNPLWPGDLSWGYLASITDFSEEKLGMFSDRHYFAGFKILRGRDDRSWFPVLFFNFNDVPIPDEFKIGAKYQQLGVDINRLGLRDTETITYSSHSDRFSDRLKVPGVPYYSHQWIAVTDFSDENIMQIFRIMAFAGPHKGPALSGGGGGSADHGEFGGR